MIRVENLTRRYAGFIALDRISFAVEKGTVAGFLGANGAGKTTTLRILSGFLPPSEGTALVGGFDTVREADSVRRLIGYLPESVPLYTDMRVDEYLRFRARIKGVSATDTRSAVDRVISRCRLAEKRRNLISALSKGQRQRVGIADALVHSPSLLILDEPTSGLDPDQRIEVRHLIHELGSEHTVLISTHILPEAEASCSQIIIIHRGRVRLSAPTATLCGAEGPWLVHISGPAPAAAQAYQCSADGDTTRVLCPDHATAMDLAAGQIRAGRSVLELSRQARSLETVFLEVTTRDEEAA